MHEFFCVDANVHKGYPNALEYTQVLRKHAEPINALAVVAGTGSLALFSASNDATCVQWELETSGHGADAGRDATPGADASLSAALPERIVSNTQENKEGVGGTGKSLSTGLIRESLFLTQVVHPCVSTACAYMHACACE